MQGSFAIASPTGIPCGLTPKKERIMLYPHSRHTIEILGPDGTLYGLELVASHPALTQAVQAPGALASLGMALANRGMEVLALSRHEGVPLAVDGVFTSTRAAQGAAVAPAYAGHDEGSVNEPPTGSLPCHAISPLNGSASNRAATCRA